MKTPGIWTIAGLIKSAQETSVNIAGTGYVPARPQIAMGVKARFKAAWLVFTGKADAVVWPNGQ